MGTGTAGNQIPANKFEFIRGDRRRHQRLEASKLRWAIAFLIIALVAAVLGFGGIAGVAIDIAKLIFYVAIVLFAIAAIVALMQGRTPTVP